MEFLFFLGLLVVGWWAWSGRKVQQANLRLQVHKDALGETEKLVNQARKRLKKRGEDAIPIEYLESFVDSVENMEFHLSESSVTKGLGDTEWLDELAGEIRFVRAILSNSVPEPLQKFHRERFFKKTFDDLEESVESLEKDPTSMEGLCIRDLIKNATEAATWFSSEEMKTLKMSKKKVKNLLEAAKEQADRYEAALAEKEPS